MRSPLNLIKTNLTLLNSYGDKYRKFNSIPQRD